MSLSAPEGLQDENILPGSSAVRNLQNDTEVFCIKRPPHFGVFPAAVHFIYDK